MNHFEKAIYDHYLDLASEQPIKTTLRAVLSDQSPERLQSLWMAVMGDEGSDVSQEELSQRLVQKQYLSDLLHYLPDDSLMALTELKQGSQGYNELCHTAGVHELVVFGLVYVYRSNLTFVMPNEIREAIEQIQVNDLQRLRWQEVLTGLRGAIHLFGIISETELLRQVCVLPTLSDVTVRSVRTILSLLLRTGKRYWRLGEWLTSTACCSHAASMQKLLKKQEAYPYKTIPIEELLRYADDTYVPQSAALTALHDTIQCMSLPAEEIVRLVGIGLRHDAPKVVLKVLQQKFKLEIDEAEQLQLLRLIYALADEIRIIRYRGHTARELSDLQCSQAGADFQGLFDDDE